MNENFATKSDLQIGLKDLEHRMDQRFQVLTQVMDSRFQAVDSRFRELEYKLTIKFGTMMALSIGVTATLVQLFK